jgi:hypothetical protein
MSKRCEKVELNEKSIVRELREIDMDAAVARDNKGPTTPHSPSTASNDPLFPYHDGTTLTIDSLLHHLTSHPNLSTQITAFTLSTLAPLSTARSSSCAIAKTCNLLLAQRDLVRLEQIWDDAVNHPLPTLNERTAAKLCADLAQGLRRYVVCAVLAVRSARAREGGLGEEWWDEWGERLEEIGWVGEEGLCEELLEAGKRWVYGKYVRGTIGMLRFLDVEVEVDEEVFIEEVMTWVLEGFTDVEPLCLDSRLLTPDHPSISITRSDAQEQVAAFHNRTITISRENDTDLDTIEECPSLPGTMTEQSASLMPLPLRIKKKQSTISITTRR